MSKAFDFEAFVAANKDKTIVTPIQKTVSNDTMRLELGDCLDILKYIPDCSVDLCLTDPPYGTTACKWDAVIPFEAMWKELKRIIKPNGAICLFGGEPFSSALRVSNIKEYKYDWVWNKIKASGHLNAKKMPMQQHENILIFGSSKLNYYPQGLVYGEFNNSRPAKAKHKNDTTYGIGNTHAISSVGNYPKTILEYSKPNDKERQHPTQKPVPLLEYLIKTYTTEGQTVLDFTMGSGSTGVAAVNTKRKFIGIEQDPKYFEIATTRITHAQNTESTTDETQENDEE